MPNVPIGLRARSSSELARKELLLLQRHGGIKIYVKNVFGRNDNRGIAAPLICMKVIHVCRMDPLSAFAMSHII